MDAALIGPGRSLGLGGFIPAGAAAGKGVIKLGLDAKQGGGMRLESLVEMPPEPPLLKG